MKISDTMESLGSCDHCPTKNVDEKTTSSTESAIEDPYQQQKQTAAPLKVYGAKTLRSRQKTAQAQRRFHHKN